MKKLMKSLVPVSALLLMLAGCAEDEEDVNVDVNEEEPATPDDETDVNVIEEDVNTTHPETEIQSDTENNGEDSIENGTDGTDGTTNTETESSPATDTEDSETNE